MKTIMEQMGEIQQMSVDLAKVLPKKEETHEKKTIAFYAHDYRDMKMSEDNLKDMLEGFVESLECNHSCSSNCRRVGCNCGCGEYHF